VYYNAENENTVFQEVGLQVVVGKEGEQPILSGLGVLSKLPLDQHSPPGSGSLVELIKYFDGASPINASVGDGDTVLKASGTFGWDVLAALIDVRFNHDSSDGGFTGDELGSDVGADFRLIAMVFGGVAMGSVDHDGRVSVGSSLLNGGGGGFDVLMGVVGSFRSTAEDNVNVLVTTGFDDRSETLISYTHKRVRASSSPHGINRNADTSIRTILEADREGNTRAQFAMKLRLSGPSTDSTPGDKICDVLGGDGIEQF